MAGTARHSSGRKINDHSAAAHSPLTVGLLCLLAVASGLMIANIYYN
jgi:hypothetical protein